MAHAKRTEDGLIRRTPGVCGGSARVGNHRIPVWVLELRRREGDGVADILQGWPALTADEVAAAWAYADAHQAEMEWEFTRNEQW